MARSTPVNSGYTIINGSGTGKNGGRIDVWVEYKLGDQNIASNYTPITAYFYAALNASYSSTTSYYSGLNSAFKVNDTAGTGVSNGAYDFTSANKVNFLGSFSGNIAHNSDGTKTISIAGSFSTVSSYISGGTVSGTIKLPTIPRESTISAVSADIGGRSTVVVNRKNDAFTHSIVYSFGTLSGYVNADGNAVASLTKLSATTINMLLPESFYYQIPNAPSGVCTLTCTTWSGNTQIGQPQTVRFTVTAARSACQPVVSGTVVDVNGDTTAMTEDPSKLIRFLSTARCTISAESRYGATITQLRINGTAVTEDSLDIPNADFDTVEFQATDSRGYTVTYKATPEIIPYIKLTNNATVQRTDPTSGNAVLTLQGKCWRGNFGVVDNVLEIKYQVNEEEPIYLFPEILEDSSYYLSVDLTGLDYQKSHTVQVHVYDLRTFAQKTLTVNKGIPVFDWGENDFQFHVPVNGDFNGTFNGAYIRTVYMADANTITVQTAYAQFAEGPIGRQSFFLFGSANGVAVYGLATVWSHGETTDWSGAGDVSLSTGVGGKLILTLPAPTAWGDFIILSAKPFSIL